MNDESCIDMEAEGGIIIISSKRRKRKKTLTDQTKTNMMSRKILSSRSSPLYSAIKRRHRDVLASSDFQREGKRNESTLSLSLSSLVNQQKRTSISNTRTVTVQKHEAAFHPYMNNHTMQRHHLSTLASTSPSSNRISFIPQKAPVKLTPKARKFFKSLLELNDNEAIIGVMLKYKQSGTGEPRMVYTFDFVKESELTDKDEPVSLEILESNDEEEIPKKPQDSYDDGLPKLYVHQHAFLKVLGCTIDIDENDFTPIMYDREGNLCDPNA